MFSARSSAVLVVFMLLGCGPGGGTASSEAGTETATESGSEGGTEYACEAWAGSFAMRAEVPVSNDGRDAAASALMPVVPGQPVELYLSQTAGSQEASTIHRVQVSASGAIEVVDSTEVSGKVATSMFAFEDALITADIESVAPTDFEQLVSSASVYSISEGVVELGASFPEGVLFSGGEVALAARSVAPGIVEAYYSVTALGSFWLRAEDGELSEQGEVELPPVAALLLADVDGDDFEDLVSAGDGGMRVHWGDAEGVDFTAEPTSLEFTEGIALAAGNIDEDPALELVSVSRMESTLATELHVFDNESGRDISERGAEPAAAMLGLDVATSGFGLSYTRPQVQLVDLDGDGFDDLLYIEAEYIEGEGPFEVEFGQHQVIARRSCGDGNFAAPTSLHAIDERIAQVHAVDFSGDGALDLLVMESSDSTLVSLEQE